MARTATGRCLLTQRWSRILFAHWPADPDTLRQSLPDGLELDLFEGRAWVGAVSLLTDDVSALGRLPLPLMTPFAQLNVRTYVRRRGAAGVYFLSLDASSAAAAAGGWLAYGLNYSAAEVTLREDAGRFLFSCRRGRGSSRLEYACRYGPTGKSKRPEEGSLERWQLERYRAFSTAPLGRGLLRADLSHQPWSVAPAEAEYSVNTIGPALGLRLSPEPPLLSYSESKEACVAPPARA